MKIGYVFTEVPQVAGMFPNAELAELARRGLDIELFILRDRPATTEEARRVERSFVTHRATYLSMAVCRALLGALFTRPGLVFSIWARILRDTGSSPRIAVKSLGILPKSIYFAGVAEKRGVRLLHAYWASLPALAASTMSRFSGLAFTTWAHAGADIYNRNHQTEASLRSRLQEAARVFTCNAANLPYFTRLVGETTARKVVLLSHGVDGDRFHYQERPAAKTISILAVGRLSPAKGFDVLLRACRRLQDAGLGFVCRIAGDGPLGPTLAALARELGIEAQVEFLGHVDHQALPALYLRSDLFVMASVIGPKGSRDGLPNVLLEAMATGLACVGSEVASIPEAIESNVTGLLLPPGDDAALAAAIELLARDPELRSRLGRAASGLVRAKYARADCMERLLEQFQSLATRESARVPAGA
jgi:glycosyltransferase involved in cell wall biosynthesis